MTIRKTNGDWLHSVHFRLYRDRVTFKPKPVGGRSLPISWPLRYGASPSYNFTVSPSPPNITPSPFLAVWPSRPTLLMCERKFVSYTQCRWRDGTLENIIRFIDLRQTVGQHENRCIALRIRSQHRLYCQCSVRLSASKENTQRVQTFLRDFHVLFLAVCMNSNINRF